MLFNKKDENEKFYNATKAEYEEIIQTQGDEVLSELGMNFSFDLLNPLVLNWIAEKEFQFADVVNSTTQNQLRVTLAEGIREGENIENLRKRIQTVFDGTVRGQAWRSRMIARTEVIGSFNYANLAAYDQSQVVQEKQWLTALDERVRPAHRSANGQIKKITEPFKVDGESLMFPGDGANGSARNVINCRCTIIPVLEDVPESIDGEIITAIDKLKVDEDKVYSQYLDKVKKDLRVGKKALTKYVDGFADYINEDIELVTETQIDNLADTLKNGLPGVHHLGGDYEETAKTRNLIEDAIGIKGRKPIYGHLSYGNKAGYGDIDIIWKKDVMERSTFTNGDSAMNYGTGKKGAFTANTANKHLASGVIHSAARNNPELLKRIQKDITNNTQLAFEELMQGPFRTARREPANRYIEAQIMEDNGQRVNQTRIEKLRVWQGYNHRITPEIEALVTELGIPIE
ncbi:MAG: minor capsid protein [Bacteroidetes bacterium]|nr:minor capsid protein [Bacteroidota bacterium]